jgi:putative hydrolase of the HAD superfamily
VSAPLAVAASFDFGQTMAELDTGMLSSRLAERGHEVSEARLEANVPAAWRAYNDAIRRGLGGHPWKLLMGVLFERSGVDAAAVPGLCDFFWDEQPKRNLWRRPIFGMIDLVRDLGRRGVRVAALSNSEGKLHQLIEELGWEDAFPVVADSGRLGMEKPAPAIFQWTARELGAPMARVVHVGDSLMADVEGALGAGMLAVWFRGDEASPPRPRLRVCGDAAATRAALESWLFGDALE